MGVMSRRGVAPCSPKSRRDDGEAPVLRNPIARGAGGKNTLRLSAQIAGEEVVSLCEMMYPLEEDTSYLLLRGTSSHYAKAFSSPCYCSREAFSLYPNPVLRGLQKRGAVISPAFGGAGGDPAPAEGRASSFVPLITPLLITPIKGVSAPFRIALLCPVFAF